MKQFLFLALVLQASLFSLHAQTSAPDLSATVAQLDRANKAADYIALSADFEKHIAATPEAWLPHYYAAYCNARLGWTYRDEGENIEPFANAAEKHIKNAENIVKRSGDKKALSEVYCIYSMLNRARVFVNPMTQGRKFGPAASHYIQLARQANPQNPRALYLEGWEKYYAPKMWGGDKKKAQEIFERAMPLFTNDTVAVEPHWGENDVQQLLGKSK